MLKENKGFDKLAAIVAELREKCPWDKKQTIHTLRQQTIEETFELADAITEKDWKGMKEELGDLLLHVLFYATIAREQNLPAKNYWVTLHVIKSKTHKIKFSSEWPKI